MIADKKTFSDIEILSYGIKSGFFLNESTCLLKEYSDSKDENALFSFTEAFPNFKSAADYTAGSFMNPQKAIKVFSKAGKEFFRFRAALPFSSDINIPFALIINAGGEGYLSAEPQNTVSEMLYELSGYNVPPEQPLKQEISPLELIVILSACDVILQNRYEGGWFTAKSLMNAFDLNGAESFDGVCAPLATVCGDYILKRFSDEDLSAVLKAMCNAEILENDELDGETFYSFGVDYKYIPSLFSKTSKSLSIFRYFNTGEADIIHIISSLSETWALGIVNGHGIIEKPDEQGLRGLLKF